MKQLFLLFRSADPSCLLGAKQVTSAVRCTCSILGVLLACAATDVRAAANKVPTVSIASPANGATFTAPATIAIAANAADSDGSIARVEFYQGSTLLGTFTSTPYKWTWGPLAGGTYSLTARAVDNLGASKTSSPVTITVAGAKLVITSPTPGSAIYAGSVTVSGTFSGDANTTVLVDNGSTTRVATLSANSFSATLPIQIGANSLRVTASRRDKTFDQTTLTVTGSGAPLLVFTSPPTTTFDAPANIKFTVDAVSPSGSIAKVDFFRGSTLLGTAAASPFEYLWSTVAAGSYAISARATDNNGIQSTATLSVLVNGPNAPPVVTLTMPADGTSFTAPANIQLAATASDSDGTINLVEFIQNGSVIGTTNIAPYVMTWGNVPAGSYALTVRATDNRSAVTTSSPRNIVVTPPNQPPAVALIGPSPGSIYTAPATIALTATATDGDGTIAKVDFFQGATLLGTASVAPYSFNWRNVPAGAYDLTAKATDNSGAVSTSGGIHVTVQANSPPTVALTIDPGAPYYAPAAVSLRANASDSDGTIARVDFYQGPALVGTTTSPPYALSLNNVPAGNYTMTAKAIDNAGASTVSNAVGVSVAPLSIAITDPVNGASIADQAITVSGTVQAPSDSGLTVNGVVAVIDPGGQFHATGVRLASGVNTILATLTTPNGQSRTDSIAVSSSGTSPVTIGVRPTQGLAPLAVTFTFTAREGVSLRRVEIDGDGDGVIDYTIQTEPWTTTLTFGGAGTAMAHMRVTDSEGNVYSSQVPIVIETEAALDQRIKAIWTGFKDALAAPDTPRALQYLGASARSRYSAAFDALSASLPQIVASFSDLQRVSLSSEMGEYAINRLINGENRIFFLYFGQDGDGVWRLQSM